MGLPPFLISIWPQELLDFVQTLDNSSIHRWINHFHRTVLRNQLRYTMDSMHCSPFEQGLFQTSCYCHAKLARLQLDCSTTGARCLKPALLECVTEIKIKIAGRFINRVFFFFRFKQTRRIPVLASINGSRKTNGIEEVSAWEFSVYIVTEIKII